MESIIKSKVCTFDFNKGLESYFEEAVCKYKDLVALKFKEENLTFMQLNKLINQLAHFLIKKGVTSNNYIGIYFDRSFELEISIMATLKIGCTCVLLDKKMPKARNQKFIDDSEINYVICDRDFINNVDFLGKTIICNLKYSFPFNESDENLGRTNDVDDTAFVFYTSGSTGTPKGVVISHGAILNDSLPGIAQPSLSSNDTILMTSPVASMRITGELFYPWFAGTKVVILEESLTNNVQENINFIIKEHISIMFIVPTMLKELLVNNRISQCKCLKYVQSLGERLPKYIRDEFYEKLDAELVNVYGQTETGCCTIYDCYYESKDTYVNSGKTVINRNIYLLSSDLRPVEKGEVGDVFIGGKYLATGYLNDSQLTSQKFMCDQFSEDGTGYMFKTGDVGRITDNDQLEYLGRKDQIVKIGAMRISILEIESAILNFSAVKDVVVKGVENNKGNEYMVAVIEGNEGWKLDKFELRRFLAEKLPGYMIPSKFIFVDEMPKLISGKLDHRKIMDIIFNGVNRKVDKDSMVISDSEIKLANIWSKNLNMDCSIIRSSDTLLELGGDSIIAVNCILDIEKAFNKEVTMEIIYNYTFKELARYIDKR